MFIYSRTLLDDWNKYAFTIIYWMYRFQYLMDEIMLDEIASEVIIPFLCISGKQWYQYVNVHYPLLNMWGQQEYIGFHFEVQYIYVISGTRCIVSIDVYCIFIQIFFDMQHMIIPIIFVVDDQNVHVGSYWCTRVVLFCVVSNCRDFIWKGNCFRISVTNNLVSNY